MAESLGLPASNAIEIENTLDIISTIILGPELKGEILEANEERVIGKMTGCPMLNAHRNIGHGPTSRNACSLPGLLPKRSRKPEPAVHHEVHEEDVHRRSPL